MISQDGGETGSHDEAARSQDTPRKQNETMELNPDCVGHMRSCRAHQRPRWPQTPQSSRQGVRGRRASRPHDTRSSDIHPGFKLKWC